MTEKTHAVPNGVIHYWMNDFQPGRAVLVFLPGLTADHRLFDKQVEAFESTYNLLAWDAPGHGKSRPFVMDFTLAQKAAWRMPSCRRRASPHRCWWGSRSAGIFHRRTFRLTPARYAALFLLTPPRSSANT